MGDLCKIVWPWNLSVVVLESMQRTWIIDVDISQNIHLSKDARQYKINK